MNDNDELDIPSFMKERRNSDHHSEEVERRGSTVSNINTRRLAQKDSKKLFRKRVATILVAGSLALTGFVGFKIGQNSAETYPHLRPGMMMTSTYVTISTGDTIESIAREYWTEEYRAIFPDFNNYVHTILEQNGLHSYTTIRPYEQIKLPVITSMDNEYLVRANVLQAEIDKYLEHKSDSSYEGDYAYWVRYTPHAGEGWLSLASKASGSVNQTYALKDEIVAKNNNCSLRNDKEIWIINPELGPIRLELEEIKDGLEESYKNQSGLQK